MHFRSRLARLFLALAAMTLALVVVEGLLRAIGLSARIDKDRAPLAEWTIYDPVLGHRNEPGYQNADLDIHIDSLGFRGPEPARPKPPGTVRIVCLGDSVTFGVWKERPGIFRADNAYPFELARLAHEHGHPGVEVINAGVLGQTAAEGLVQLLVQVRALEPDVVTVRFGNNDHGRGFIGDLTPMANEIEYAVVRWMPTWAWNTELVRLVFHAYRGEISRRRRIPSSTRLTAERFEIMLRHFVDVARADRFHLVFLDFPYRELERGVSPGESFPNVMQEAKTLEALHEVHGRYQAVVARVAAETGTPFVVTEPALRREGGAAFGDHDLSHPTPLGARAIAAELLAALERLGWLDGARTRPGS